MKTSLAILFTALGVLLPASEMLAQTPPRRPPIPYKFPLPVANGAFACYADQGTPLTASSPLPTVVGRDLNGFVTWSNRMDNDVCRRTCGTRGFQYAGTQSGAFCFCGDTAGSFGNAPACHSLCTGRPGEVCGGSLANSVSQVAFTPPAGPPMPANGGQCVLDVTGPGYHHYEIQTFAITGRTPNANGTAVYSVNWSTVAAGSYHASTPSGGGHSTGNIRTWTVSGSAAIQFRTLLIPSNNHMLFSYVPPLASAPLQEIQTHYIDGIAQVPSGTTTSAWSQFATQTIDIAPRTTNPLTFPMSFTLQQPPLAIQYHAAPGGSTGQVQCNWSVAL
ncbi:MAG TPA: WSC domain-containing protein [Steroidobacteraceae bacterium]|jgi:hypothetical protein